MIKPKILLYGGTFDPIHNGHLSILKCAIEQGCYDKILVYVSDPAGHKNPEVCWQTRFILLRDAITEGNFEWETPQYMKSHIKLDVLNKMFAYEVVLEYTKIGYDVDFLVGADTVQHMPKWKCFDTFNEHATVVIADRAKVFGEWIDILKPIRSYKFIAVPEMDISSTIIRQRIAQDISICNLVPEITQEEIKIFDLYKE